MRFLPSNAATKCALGRQKNTQICTRFFNQKSPANLNYFTLNKRANNFTSDGEKLIAVCYSQQKLWSFKKCPRIGTLSILGYTNRGN